MKCHALEKQRVKVRKSEIVYNKMQMHLSVSKERENARDVRECEKKCLYYISQILPICACFLIS